MRRSRIQRRSWLALIPFARATPATDAPEWPQASIKDCLNSSEWVRRGLTLQQTTSPVPHQSLYTFSAPCLKPGATCSTFVLYSNRI